MSGSDLAIVADSSHDDDERPEHARWDEPAFTSPHLQQLYRSLVADMESEIVADPALRTVTAMMIRTVARDYVVRLTADQGEPRARQLERDRRMMAMLKQLAENVHRTDSRGDAINQLVLGLVPVLMGVIDSRLGHERVLATKVKEDIGAELSAYLRRELPG